MSIASVITGGFGQSVALIITDGYSIGVAIVIPPAAVTGGGIGHGRKRKRYLIKDRLYNLTDSEFQQIVSSFGQNEEVVKEIKKPAKKLVKAIIGIEKQQFDIDGNVYYQIPNLAELRKFAMPPDR